MRPRKKRTTVRPYKYKGKHYTADKMSRLLVLDYGESIFNSSTLEYIYHGLTTKQKDKLSLALVRTLERVEKYLGVIEPIEMFNITR